MEAKFSNNFFSVVKLLCCALPLSPGPLKYSQFWGFSKLVIFTYKFTLSVFCNLKHFGCFESCECGLMLRFLWQKKKKKRFLWQLAVGGLGTREPLLAVVDSASPRLLPPDGPRLSLLLF